MSRRPDYLAHAVLALGGMIFVAPIWIAFAAATQRAGAINRGDVSLLPRLSGLHTFIDVLGFGPAASGGTPIGRMLLVSFAMALAIALGKIAISALSAFAIVFFRFPGRRIAFWMILITLMLPVEVRIIPTYAVIADFHLINTFTGLTMPLIASATATLLFRQVFLAIPDEMVEAAKLDGAGAMRFFLDMVLPVSAANLAALFVILFVYGWNQYLWPLLAVTNGHLVPIVLGIARMITTDPLTAWNLVMAATIWAILPPVAVVLLMQRWFVRGLTEADK